MKEDMWIDKRENPKTEFPWSSVATTRPTLNCGESSWRKFWQKLKTRNRLWSAAVPLLSFLHKERCKKESSLGCSCSFECPKFWCDQCWQVKSVYLFWHPFFCKLFLGKIIYHFPWNKVYPTFHEILEKDSEETDAVDDFPFQRIQFIKCAVYDKDFLEQGDVFKLQVHIVFFLRSNLSKEVKWSHPRFESRESL